MASLTKLRISLPEDYFEKMFYVEKIKKIDFFWAGRQKIPVNGKEMLGSFVKTSVCLYRGPPLVE